MWRSVARLTGLFLVSLLGVSTVAAQQPHYKRAPQFAPFSPSQVTKKIAVPTPAVSSANQHVQDLPTMDKSGVVPAEIRRPRLPGPLGPRRPRRPRPTTPFGIEEIRRTSQAFRVFANPVIDRHRLLRSAKNLAVWSNGRARVVRCYTGRHHQHWSHCCYNGVYRRWLYFDPMMGRYYNWCAPLNAFLPVGCRPLQAGAGGAEVENVGDPGIPGVDSDVGEPGMDGFTEPGQTDVDEDQPIDELSPGASK